MTTDADESTDRKSLRMERRELLYAIVRESMARIGMLSSSYKYKVLSLDSRGRQYLIMMDLPHEMARNTDQLAEIEGQIAHTARTRHEIDVTALYWRVNQPAAVSVVHNPKAGAERSLSRPEATVREVRRTLEESRQARGPATANGRFEPIRPDEVAAFKQAVAAGIKSDPPAKAVPGTRKPSAPDFAPTQFVNHDEEETNPRLSRTQYGDLI